MLHCDRCGLYSKGEATINEYIISENSKKDYEINNEFTKSNKTQYGIICGYDSKYDGTCLVFLSEIDNLEKLKNRFSWITEINYTELNNICDSCISQMIFNKEIRNESSYDYTEFYTICCDKYYTEIDNTHCLVNKENRFPYLSYYYITNSDFYIREDIFPFKYYHGCVVCKKCITSFSNSSLKNLEKLDFINTYRSPVFYTLKNLRREIEVYLDPKLKGKQITKNMLCKFNEKERIYMYLSKFNNLLIKKELLLYIVKRNLSIIKTYIPLNKDVINYILKFV